MASEIELNGFPERVPICEKSGESIRNFNLNDTTFLIITWNLLTQAYAKIGEDGYSPDDYLDPNIFNPDVRKGKIFLSIKECMKLYPIFCFQEVETSMASDLDVFFRDNGYTSYYHSYGGHWDNYMGVYTVIPNKYKVLKVDRFRPSDIYPWKDVPKDSNWRYILDKLTLGLFGLYNDNPYPHYTNMKNRRNFMLSVLVEVSPESDPVLISNIHMPCNYKEPCFMEVYTSLVLSRISKLSSEYKSEYVLAGDFNIKPHSDTYSFITHGRMSGLSKNWIKRNFIEPSNSFNELYIKQGPETFYTVYDVRTHFPAMTSTYFDTHKMEPKFTTFCNSRNNPFKDTLDYIFVSEGLITKDSMVLKRMENDRYMPNEDEPSDHLPLISHIEIE